MGKRYAASLQQKKLSLSMSGLMGFRSVFAATEIWEVDSFCPS
jgi:hypothetical protein